MPHLSILSSVDQVTARLRSDLQSELWTGTMPGVIRLERELGVNRKTVESALQRLEHDGLLASQGPGRKRLIIKKKSRGDARPMRVAILDYERGVNQHLGYKVHLRHELLEAGHTVFSVSKTLLELGMDVQRVARFVRRTPADAWIVYSGSRDVLRWFATGTKPAFAIFGQRAGLKIASVGPDKPTAMATATRELIVLGHRRIALLCHRERRIPEPGGTERAFLAELTAQGIATSAFNLPDWDDTIEGFSNMLNSLLRLTPPTALIVDEAPQFIAAMQFLASKGIRVPEKISLICTDPDPVFAWCKPTIAHISWDSDQLIKRIVRWAAHVSKGREDTNQTFVPAQFIPGGTIGPAP